uniref:Uncharacterized protein n=1 Tax=Glossina austeni TaxID=7395 RepID=A0A1A9VGR7_GLOAU
MRIIHGSVYLDKDKRGYINVVAENMFLAMQSMIKPRDMLSISYSKEDYSELAALVMNVDYETVTTEDAYSSGIKTLWADTARIQTPLDCEIGNCCDEQCLELIEMIEEDLSKLLELRVKYGFIFKCAI